MRPLTDNKAASESARTVYSGYHASDAALLTHTSFRPAHLARRLPEKQKSAYPCLRRYRDWGPGLVFN